MESLTLIPVKRVEPGQYSAEIRNFRIDGPSETAYINFKLVDGKEIPGASYKVTNPTGYVLFHDILLRLGWSDHDILPCNVSHPVTANCTVTVTENKVVDKETGEERTYFNTSIKL